MKISPEHMKALTNDLNSKDDRAFKEIVAFLIVFGKPLYECLEKEYESQNPDVLLQCWNIAGDIGGVFSEKLKAFGCGGFQPNCLTWNHLIFKYKVRESKKLYESCRFFAGCVWNLRTKEMLIFSLKNSLN